MTNEEWLRTCSTEEFAEWIASEINERVKLALHDSELNDGDVDADFYMEDSDDWKEWLKQPRKPISWGQENGRGDNVIYQDENGFYFVIDGYKWYLAGLSLSVVCG